MPVRQISQSELDALFGSGYIVLGMQKPTSKSEDSNSLDKKKGKLRTTPRMELSNKSSSQ